ncbi:serine protease [Reyranella sp. CPCC 100927]|uniref:S1 family peptidase n=1 Tax=Reyranella sp. CPCC 100927 TaxID=2599616 RepID=UPI0011B77B08|nr:serine protease [Reyranella sp. CPCC 100927]TWT08838.1 trypsin-like peptidase domain-containing protein [Reyranella sp. CPCC 100927]
MADPVNMSSGNQGGNDDRKSNTGLKAVGFVAGGILLLLIGLGLGWYFFYRVQVNVTVQAPPPPPAPPAPKPDPAAVRALEDALEKQKAGNKALEDQIAKLRDALQGNVCTITDPRGLGITPPGPGGAPGPQTPAPGGGNAPGTPKSTAAEPKVPVKPDIKAGNPDASTGKPETPPAPTGTIADLVPVLENATVLILAQKTQGLGTGTGFFVSRDIVLTNNHVVNDLSDSTVFITSRKLGTVLEGEVIGAVGGGSAGGADFAVVRVNGTLPSHIKPLGLGVEPASLKEVVAAGYPGAILRNDRNFLELLKGDPSKAPELVLTKGEVSAVQNRDRGLPSIAHTASISSGNSGGPLVDRCGRVVGINTFVTRAEAGAGGGFAIGATGISKFLRANDVGFDWIEAACTK